MTGVRTHSVFVFIKIGIVQVNKFSETESESLTENKIKLSFKSAKIYDCT